MLLLADMLPPLHFTGSVLLVLVAMAITLWYVLRRRHAALQLQRAARRYARGDFSNPPQITGPGELADLSDALTQMAQQLDSRLSTVVAQRNELGAVLSSMAEGVVAIDEEENLLSLNATATQMLELDAAKAIGQPIQAVVRNAGLQTIVRDTFRKQMPIQAEIVLHDHRIRGQTVGQTDRFIQVQSAILRSQPTETQNGVLLVLHDVTQVRRLESMRRDFVANVSHEIKTPIAAIKAAVESLIDDADPDNPIQGRFLGIIDRQADRMAAIIEDLLALARIEQGQESLAQQLKPGKLLTVLQSGCETCQANAKNKNSQVDLVCDPTITVWMQPSLLEQAIVNLVDNAIKYSPPESEVLLKAVRLENEVVIQVHDQGRGIEPQHLPRIFERFYRTDKARSRQMGGTGLGLSIVKHVAEAHNGRVSVQSTPGKGSLFCIHLPDRQETPDHN